MQNGQNDVMQILLVEDNPGDIRLTQEALKEGDMPNVLHVVKDGVEAMEFLRKKGKYAESPTPDIILLDLNLPRKDGREVLADIKTDENLKMIPVIVLTTSDTDRDIIKSYKLHANCFITKPVDLELFIFIIRQIETFWFRVIKLPPKNHNHF
ncbi:MAG: response regulator [Chitinophagales bacterium]